MSIYRGNNLIAGQGSDIDLIRDLHDPDWSGAIKGAGHVDGTFTCPSRGFINFSSTEPANSVRINDINLENLFPYGSFPVNAGDKLTWNTVHTASFYYIFVPYKAQ